MLQTLTHILYPPSCASCAEPVEMRGGLCPTCWKDTPFIHAPFCRSCGVQLPGVAAEHDGDPLCDDCLREPPPWQQGRSIFMYDGVARKLILGLKHADRHDVVAPLAGWLAPLARDLAPKDPVIVPVPLHPWRQIKRRYNQSELIARDLGQRLDWPVQSRALRRTRHTPSLDGVSRAGRFEALEGAVALDPKSGQELRHKDVILVDDVMTTGATLTTCTHALLAADVASVSVLTLARVSNLP